MRCGVGATTCGERAGCLSVSQSVMGRRQAVERDGRTRNVLSLLLLLLRLLALLCFRVSFSRVLTGGVEAVVQCASASLSRSRLRRSREDKSMKRKTGRKRREPPLRRAFPLIYVPSSCVPDGEQRPPSPSSSIFVHPAFPSLPIPRKRQPWPRTTYPDANTYKGTPTFGPRRTRLVLEGAEEARKKREEASALQMIGLSNATRRSIYMFCLRGTYLRLGAVAPTPESPLAALLLLLLYGCNVQCACSHGDAVVVALHSSRQWTRAPALLVGPWLHSTKHESGRTSTKPRQRQSAFFFCFVALLLLFRFLLCSAFIQVHLQPMSNDSLFLDFMIPSVFLASFCRLGMMSKSWSRGRGDVAFNLLRSNLIALACSQLVSYELSNPTPLNSSSSPAPHNYSLLILTSSSRSTSTSLRLSSCASPGLRVPHDVIAFFDFRFAVHGAGSRPQRCVVWTSWYFLPCWALDLRFLTM